MEFPKDVYDIVIIGGGPAGFTAGIYASRARMNTLLIESLSVMGQATMTEKIENYPGFESIGGFELIDRFKKHGAKFGLATAAETVSSIAREEVGGVSVWTVRTEEQSVRALAVIIATGARPKKLGAPGEEELSGKGVSYCATCDGAFFRNKEIVVVGGGNSAVEETIYLTRFASKITVVHRRNRLRASKILQEELFSHDKVQIAWGSVIEKIEGDSKVEKVVLKNVQSEEKYDIPCEGVFIFTGWSPNTEFLKGRVDLDENGHIYVDQEMNTSAEGIFACGDCSRTPLHQVVTACGDGATAAYTAGKHVEKLKGIVYE